MNWLSGACFLLCFQAASCILNHVGIAQAQISSATDDKSPSIVEWTSTKVEHAYGLPDTKANQKGVLTINSGGFIFTGNSGSYTIPRPALLAVSTRNERVELWGMKGGSCAWRSLMVEGLPLRA